MKIVKKTLALALALILSLSLAACAGQNTTWAAKSGELTVPAGLYIERMITAYYGAVSQVDQEAKDPLKEQIDGVTVADKITEDAKKSVSQYLAVEKMFDEMGLSLTEEQQMNMSQVVDYYWSMLETAYLDNGISKDSYTKSIANDEKKSVIFQAIYGEGGTQEVPEAELKAKFVEDYAKIIIMPLNLKDSEGNPLPEETLQKTRDLVDKYYNLAKEGGDMEELLYEAKKESSSDPDSVTKPEKGSSFSFLAKSSTTYDKEVVDQIFAAPIGEPVKIETQDNIYLVMRYQTDEDPADFEARKTALLSIMKSDEFQAKLDEYAAGLEITWNDASIKRYTADKLKV